MIFSTEHRATKAMVLGFLLVTLLATLLATASVDAVTTSGNAYGWGDNFLGQLGNGAYGNETNTPGAVNNIQGVDRVKAGCNHSLALKNDGTLRAWGSNRDGRLGNGSTSDFSSVPVKVQIENVKAIAVGCDHNLALKENGTVWAWGDNFEGELGNGASGDGAYSNVPVKVASIGNSAKGIAAGDDFSLALLQDGTVRSWGENTYGQLGNGATLPGTYEATPVRVANLSNVRAVATGGYHSLALLSSGRVKSWGNNYDGQLGNGTHGAGTNRSTPGSVSGLDNVRSISGGTDHSLAVLESGAARSWGDNLTGQLGNCASGDGADSDVPVAVKNLTGVKNMDGGSGHTLAATQ